jgi:hypothetical protein
LGAHAEIAVRLIIEIGEACGPLPDVAADDIESQIARLVARSRRNVSLAPADPAVGIARLDNDRLELGVLR